VVWLEERDARVPLRGTPGFAGHTYAVGVHHNVPPDVVKEVQAFLLKYSTARDRILLLDHDDVELRGAGGVRCALSERTQLADLERAVEQHASAALLRVQVREKRMSLTAEEIEFERTRVAEMRSLIEQARYDIARREEAHPVRSVLAELRSIRKSIESR
jgi:hypothetical protein